MSVVESWIIEGENDKSKNYGFDLPQGTWMISMKVNNDEIWDKVKLGEVKGFSIEGYFADRYEMNSKNIDMEEKAMVEKIKELITKSELKTNKVELAIPDPTEYDKLAFQIYSDSNKFADKTNLTIVNNYKNAVDKIKTIMDSNSKEYTIIQNKAKELGLDIAQTPIGKEFLKAGTQILKYHKSALDQQVKYASIKP
jgi:hypothetical protein